MSGVKAVVILSGLLALTSFGVVIATAPADPPPRVAGDGGPRPPSVADMTARLRRALSQGRTEAARNLAARMTQHHPQDPESWLWSAITGHMLGDSAEAQIAGEQLRTMLQDREPPFSQRAQSMREYRMGWALWVQNRREEAADHFALAADLYEPATASENDDAIRSYNLACYRAMAGQIDRAAGCFADAVDAGYPPDGGWWRVDPDLDPIRDEPAFLAAAAEIEQRLRRDPAEVPRPGENPDDFAPGSDPDD